MAVRFAIVTLVLCSFLTGSISVQSNVTVFPDCSNGTVTPCIELDVAFQNLTSDTALYLEPGEHTLHRYHGVIGLHDVSIIGADAKITCADEIGVVFMNMRRLVISEIVIDGCGLSNGTLRNATGTVKEFLDLNFVIPASVTIAVFIANCTDLSMTNSVVANTTGLGLLGVNIVGNSRMSNVSFLFNIRPKCEKEPRSFPFYLQQGNSIRNNVGGGAYLLYQDPQVRYEVVNSSTLLISECKFVQNAECTYTGYVNVNYRYFGAYGLPSLNYTIGGGGGLSLFMPQVTFAVNVSISDSEFTSNEARYGSGAHIGFFSESGVSAVNFFGCVFKDNGSPVEQEFHAAEGGAGVAVFMDLKLPTGASEHHSVGHVDCSSINFEDTNFTHNSAIVEGGGVFMYSLSMNQLTSGKYLFYSFVNFTRCHFLGNIAKFGSGLFISQKATLYPEGTWGVFLRDVTVMDGRLPHIPTDSADSSTGKLKCSAVEFIGILILLMEGSLFIHGNTASGLHLTSSGIYLMVNTVLISEGNWAQRGGGAYLEGYTPIIGVSPHSSLILRNNSAATKGGGVYYDNHITRGGTLEPLDSVDCFLSTSKLYQARGGDDIFDSNITIEFLDNVAPIASMVFGSTLNSCSWAENISVSDKDLFLELYYNYNSVFKFSDIPNGTDVVSTEPTYIKVLPADRDISIYPGQVRHVTVDVVDEFFNKVDAVLSSEVARSIDDYYDVKVGSSGSWYLRTKDHTVPIYVHGEGKSITMSLCIASNLVCDNITVDIHYCSIGFAYDNETEKCRCDSLIEKPIICDERDMQLSVPPLTWLGCMNSSKCSSTRDLILLECYFSYCNPEENIFNVSDPSSLCANDSHRSGILCGECADGYSMVFGADECWNCSGTNPGIILGTWAIQGFTSFLFVVLVGSTFKKGLAYVILLFSNIVFPYYVYDSGALLKYMLAPFHFFAQEAVFAYCFSDGLNALAKVGLQFVYCAYLYALMALFTILCRCSSLASRYFSAARTLSILIFVTFNLIFTTCAQVLSGVVVNNLAGTNKSIRWLINPNLVYFHGWHAPLCAASLVLALVFIILFPLLLLSPTLAYRYGQRFKPFLDAIWAPFKPKYRIWTSLRITVRILVIVFSRFLVTTSLAGIKANISILIIFLFAESILQPFNEMLVNVVDTMLTLIAVFMHMGAYWKLSQEWSFASSSFNENFFFAFLLALSHILIVATFLWYYRSTLQKIPTLFSKCCKKRHDQYEPLDTPAQRNIQSRPTHTSVSIVQQPKGHQHPRRTFTRIRESLLEDESLQFVAT